MISIQPSTPRFGGVYRVLVENDQGQRRNLSEVMLYFHDSCPTAQTQGLSLAHKCRTLLNAQDFDPVNGNLVDFAPDNAHLFVTDDRYGQDASLHSLDFETDAVSLCPTALRSSIYKDGKRTNGDIVLNPDETVKFVSKSWNPGDRGFFERIALKWANFKTAYLG